MLTTYPVLLLVGGKRLPHETYFGPTDVCRHLWEANKEPKLEPPVDTVTCGRRKANLPNYLNLLQRMLNIDYNIF